MSNDIYLQLGIDSSKLKRDYIKYPIYITKNRYDKSEKPYKEDLEYLYIELNIPRIDLMNYFNISESTLERWLRYYNIKKDKKLHYDNVKKTNLEKYGVEHPLQSKEVKEKRKQNWIKKYGVENPLQLKEVKEKRKQTWIKKYGVESTNQLKEVKEKMKQTWIKKYGVENPAQSKEVKEKMKRSNLEKYGVENPAQSKEVKEKRYNTMKKNHTFNTSKPEEQIYELLKLKFKEVKRQHKEDRYPFNCDFYIPELDLFIEYQGYFTHGNEPYTGTKKQKNKVKLWESKNTTKYNDAINVWTKRDPLKRKIAKENKLNYLEFF